MGGVALFRFSLAFATIVLGATLLYEAPPLYGQAPTSTPIPTPLTATAGSVFLGTVTLNGQRAPDGTHIEAVIRDTVCGTTTVQGGRYDILVRSGTGSGPEYQQGCGSTGPSIDTVVFRSGQLIATERGQFIPHAAQQLDLTFGQAATPTTGGGLPTTGYAPSDRQNGTFVRTKLLVVVALASFVLAAAIRVVGRRTRPYHTPKFP